MSLSTIANAPKIDAILQEKQIYGFEAVGGTDKQTIHSYGPVYEHLLSPLINKKATILEVGVAYGGSMLIWHELCPKSSVIGVDIINNVHPSIFERMDDNRYSFIVGNAYTDDTVAQVKKAAPDGIDFMIDDGPHSLESQCAFLRMYVPLLKKGGIAVVEDVQDMGWFDPLRACVSDDASIESVDRRGIKNRYDDLMIIVRT